MEIKFYALSISTLVVGEWRASRSTILKLDDESLILVVSAARFILDQLSLLKPEADWLSFVLSAGRLTSNQVRLYWNRKLIRSSLF
jgi:hypothetical protein